MRLKDRQLLAKYIGPGGLNMSGRQLAKNAGLKPAIVGHLLSGRRATCSKATAEAIERALEAPTGLLFADDEALGTAA